MYTLYRVNGMSLVYKPLFPRPCGRLKEALGALTIILCRPFVSVFFYLQPYIFGSYREESSSGDNNKPQ